MRQISRCVVVMLAFALLFTISATAFAQIRTNPNPLRIFPIETSPFGNSYGDWSAAWWQWAFAQPVSTNPLFDETGALCGNGQAGRVFFLGGVFNVSGTAVRNCTVPAGKGLFFPLLNVECSNVEGNGNDAPTLRACGDFFASLGKDLFLVVDGGSFANLQRFRMPSPTFNFTLPDGNLLQAFGVGAPAGTCKTDAAGICQPYLSLSDGFYVMLAPLSTGAHTIRFGGTFGDPINFTTDVTYNLTVQ